MSKGKALLLVALVGLGYYGYREYFAKTRNGEPAPSRPVKIGDRVRVVKEPAPIMVRDKTLARVGPGTAWTVVDIRDKWLRVRLPWSEKDEHGWIKESHVQPILRASQAKPCPWNEDLLLQAEGFCEPEFRKAASTPDGRARSMGVQEDKALLVVLVEAGQILITKGSETLFVTAKGPARGEAKNGRWSYQVNSKTDSARFEGEYVAGQRNGTWLQWDKEDLLVGMARFDHGKRVE